jgi:hypothetical protein
MAEEQSIEQLQKELRGTNITLTIATMGVIALGGLSAYISYNSTTTPKNTNSQYVNPKTIEFRVEDKDFDKMKETYITVNGKDYLFKLVDGKPECVPYTIEHKIVTGSKK